MTRSPHRSLATGLGVISLAALIAVGCARDATTQSVASDGGRRLDPTSLVSAKDFIPGCNDCDPWIPSDTLSLPTHQIGVAMSGPKSQRPNLTCNFGAVVNPSGAVPPYSYEWTDGNQESYQQTFHHLGFGAGSAYTVTLTVTDAQGNQGTVARTVNVGSQYGNC